VEAAPCPPAVACAVGNVRFRGPLVLDHTVYFVSVEGDDEADALAALLIIRDGNMTN